MPNIVEYTSKSDLTPSDRGINTAAEAARVYQYTANKIGHDISKGLHDIGDAVEKHQAIMETSEAYKSGTDFEINAIKDYEAQSALPENRGNPYFGDRFMAEVSERLDQWGNSVRTDHAKQIVATLKASIRNKIFNHVAAGQAEMDVAHVDDNITGVMGNLASGLAIDPSERNLRQSLGTADNAIQGMTATISDVGMRERASMEYKHRFMSELVVARYENGVANSIRNQIAETGGETSPALEQYKKDIEKQVGFEYLSPAEQTRVSKLGDQAVSQGQELYNSRHATAKAQMVAEGQAAYAQIHNETTKLAIAGQGPTPELIESVQAFSQRYGQYLPGEVAALDDFIIRGQDRAQRNAVQPFNQQVRDSIQAGFSLPKGDPRRPTLASLVANYSGGEITADDLKGYTEILNKLDKPQDDPAFKAAWDNFVRWRDAAAASIGGSNPSNPNNTAVRSRFVNDVTNNFMARGKAMGDWDRAYERVTNPNLPGSFANPTILKVYNDGANRGIDWLNNVRGWPQWNPNNNTLTWPSGNGGGRPAAPSAVPAAPAKPVAPAADLQKADEILWGKK